MIPTPHNPKKFSKEKVGVSQGYRLLDMDEIRFRMDDHEEIERWDGFMFWKKWIPWNYGSNPEFTFRTKLSREELARL
jgi:hypothetical protein